MLEKLRAAPITRHDLVDLVPGASARSHRVRLVDALYIELAERTGGTLITTHLRPRGEPHVEAIEA